jgi:hypothetical protein
MIATTYCREQSQPFSFVSDSCLSTFGHRCHHQRVAHLSMMTLTSTFVLLAALAVAQSPVDEAKAIAAVKRTNVQGIDPTVKNRQPLEAWLTSLTLNRSKLAWEVNDCGEATGSTADQDRDLPVCVEARGNVSRERQIVVSVAVGTNRTGLTASRELAFASLIDSGGSIRFAKNLSELASWVR